MGKKTCRRCGKLLKKQNVSGYCLDCISAIEDNMEFE